RDRNVTGVQTCALPISYLVPVARLTPSAHPAVLLTNSITPHSPQVLDHCLPPQREAHHGLTNVGLNATTSPLHHRYEYGYSNVPQVPLAGVLTNVLPRPHGPGA